jgi:hypothetical protein
MPSQVRLTARMYSTQSTFLFARFPIRMYPVHVPFRVFPTLNIIAEDTLQQSHIPWLLELPQFVKLLLPFLLAFSRNISLKVSPFRTGDPSLWVPVSLCGAPVLSWRLGYVAAGAPALTAGGGRPRCLRVPQSQTRARFFRAHDCSRRIRIAEASTRARAQHPGLVSGKIWQP